VVERPQIYVFDSCIAPKMVIYELQELVSCRDDFTQNRSSMVNGKRKVYNTQLQEEKIYENIFL